MRAVSSGGADHELGATAETLKERQLDTLLVNRYTIMRRCKTVESRLAFKKLEASFDKKRFAALLATPASDDAEHAALDALAKLDVEQSAAVAELRQSILDQISASELAEDAIRDKLMADHAAVNL
jgi:hypothetical protein